MFGSHRLQRFLARANTTFTTFVDDARRDTALRLLDERDIRIVDVGLMLGYSDHAHFTRAFRRWTSVSPTDYRRALLDQRDDREVPA